MGFLDHFSGLVSVKKRRKSKPMQTVDIKVKMDCDGCERRVRHAACSIKGLGKDSGGEQEGEQGECDRVCGCKQSVEEDKEHWEEGRYVALCGLQLGGLPLRLSGLRQESSGRLC
ncbi:hypothetical protein Syun_022711 [Stephania yunnanensis]|uniref:HMA domain-containing protein n=1 Tax=Stephania yunnanensis TaxID=152371 RepID=A0AAP0FA03_9MAGN